MPVFDTKDVNASGVGAPPLLTIGVGADGKVCTMFGFDFTPQSCLRWYHFYGDGMLSHALNCSFCVSACI